MKRLLVPALIAVLSVLPLRAPLDAASALDGLWDAVVVASGTEIPFRFEIASSGSQIEGFFFEGDRKIGRMRSDATVTHAENGVATIQALERGAAGSRLALVAR